MWTVSEKTWDGVLENLGRTSISPRNSPDSSSMGPRWVLNGSSMGPQWVLQIRGANEVESRWQRGMCRTKIALHSFQLLQNFKVPRKRIEYIAESIALNRIDAKLQKRIGFAAITCVASQRFMISYA
jgi:hypothetical protein